MGAPLTSPKNPESQLHNPQIMQKIYYVYILSNFKKTTLYTGVTSNLKKRIHEHRQGHAKAFTQKYKLKYLMYYETFESIHNAISREKFIKGKKRLYKENLITAVNPGWEDLSQGIF